MKEASPQLKSALLEAQAIGATRAEPSPWRVDPPVAPRRPASVVVHGDVRIDEYAWLRNREDPAVLAYLEAENAYTDAMMAPVDDLREQLFAELVGRIKEDDTTVPEERDGWLYYLRTETGRQYPSVCRRRASVCRPITPPAPVWFSTTIDVPSALAKAGCAARVIASTPEPAALGSTKRTGCCAAAAPAARKVRSKAQIFLMADILGQQDQGPGSLAAFQQPV